jgi:hypothetical protein
LFRDVEKKVNDSCAPDVVASIVTTHSSTKMVKESFIGKKSFPLSLVQARYR